MRSIGEMTYIKDKGTSMRRKMETRLSNVRRHTRRANGIALGSKRGAKKNMRGNANLWKIVRL